jgi:hypothetical protein
VSATLPPDAPRLPSFLSALVARRYAFHVQAKLSSKSGICLHNRLRLKVPVQVVHAPLEKEFDTHFEVDLDDDSKSPIYVPSTDIVGMVYASQIIRYSNKDSL